MLDLIGLHGKKQSGKDTAYGILNDNLGDLVLKREGFADRLKISFARLFLEVGDQSNEAYNYEGWTDDECIAFANHFKERGRLVLPEFRGGEMPDGIDVHTWAINDVSGREVLQRYGTEAHRDVFGSDFWIDAVLPNPSAMNLGRGDYDEWDILVVTDVRFPNEAEAILEAGGEIWHIIRPGIDDGDSHASEIPLTQTYINKTIINDGTLEEFSQKVMKKWETTVNSGHLKTLRF